MPADRTAVHEPFARVLARNLAIALGVGAALAFRRHEPRLLLPLSGLALWFSLGGHYVEMAFLEGIRPRLPSGGLLQRSTRLAAWFMGGALLYVAMALTARDLPVPAPRLGLWWLGGLAFIGLELVVHAILALRRRPSFYTGGG